MRYELNNIHLDIEVVYDDIVITFKEGRIVLEEQLEQIAADLLKLAEQAPEKWIVLDFKRVKFMSSAFLGLLVKLQKTVTQGRGHLKLRNVSTEIYKVFTITNLQKVFKIETAP